MKPGGKSTKVPYQACRPGVKASSTDPSTWSDYATAVAAAEHADGIGFVITNSDIAAFDVDDCRDPATGAIEPWTTALVARAGSYAEVTISGTGIRIIGTATGDKVHRKLRVVNGVTVEPYRRAERYIVMTGDALPGSPSALANIDAAIDAVVAELGGTTGNGRETGGATFDPGEIEDIEPTDARLAGLEAKWIKLGHDGTGMEEYSDHRSRGVFAFACECVRAEVPDDAIASCLLYWKIGEHVRDQSDVMRAVKRTIGRAHDFVKDSTLFKMNERHCVLPIGGKTRIATWGEDPDFPGYQTITRLSHFEDFRALQDKYRITYQRKDKKGNMETVTVGRGSWWIGHPRRRQYDGGMRFMPTKDEGVVDDTLNLWRGFGVATRKPAGRSGAAGCKNFLDHGLKVICSDVAAHFDYLIKREAWIAQRRRRSETAVALLTEEEGTGKGVWARTFGRLYGRHAMQLLRPEHVVGKFNPHLESLLMVIADEAMFVGDPRHRNVLHGLITEPVIPIERKFVDVYNAENFLNVYTLSNNPHTVNPGVKGGRRYFIPTVSSERASDHEYFRKIMVELEDEGGYEALLYHLLHEVDVRDFNVRDVPKTAGLAEQAAYSRKGVDLLVEKACCEALVPCGYKWADFSSTTAVSNNNLSGLDYFVDHHPDRELSRLGALAVKRRLAQEWGCVTNVRRRIENARVYGVFWPPLRELRKKFEAKHGKQEWPNPEVEEWQERPDFF
jgi:hypothetical protein